MKCPSVHVHVDLCPHGMGLLPHSRQLYLPPTCTEAIFGDICPQVFRIRVSPNRAGMRRSSAASLMRMARLGPMDRILTESVALRRALPLLSVSSLTPWGRFGKSFLSSAATFSSRCLQAWVNAFQRGALELSCRPPFCLIHLVMPQRNRYRGTTPSTS